MPRLHALLHENRYRLHWRALLVLLAATAAVFAFRPDRGVPPDFTYEDKLQHLLAFGSMAIAGTLGFAARARVAAALLGYGVFIEIVQLWVPGRDASVDDVVADAIGIALGLLAVALLRRHWPAR